MSGGRALLALLLTAGAALAGESAPRVVATAPENGAADVDPGLERIAITFSEPMREGSCSLMKAGAAFPEVRAVRYEAGGTKLVLEVRLKPGALYRLGINGPRATGFRSAQGVPARPEILGFMTAGAPPLPPPAPLRPGRIAFDFQDAWGRRFRSADYKGRPLFLVFGPDW